MGGVGQRLWALSTTLLSETFLLLLVLASFILTVYEFFQVQDTVVSVPQV